jgi:hypothetical protein
VQPPAPGGFCEYLLRAIGTAEGRLTDQEGRLLAHGTTTCLITCRGTIFLLDQSADRQPHANIERYRRTATMDRVRGLELVLRGWRNYNALSFGGFDNVVTQSPE